MSLDAPVYSTNPILDGLEHVGHFLHEGEHFVAENLPKYIALKGDLETQYPTLKAEVVTVAQDASALAPLGTAIAAALANKGINLLADTGVIAAFEAAAPQIVKTANDVTQLAKTLGADLSVDTAALV